MKKPSKSMAASLRGQRVGGRSPDAISQGRQRPASAAGMVIPGEGDVCNPPGSAPAATAKRFAGAVGKHFGGGN